MTTIGETRRNKWHGLEVYHACVDCGKERWIQTKLGGQPRNERCRSCSQRITMTGLKGEKCRAWKSGRSSNGAGYIIVAIQPDDFFYPMVQRGRDGKGTYVLEHRLVMAKHLGRCLQPFETVHHKNGIKDDNRIENLEIGGSQGEHALNHSKGYRDGFQRGYQDGKDKHIKELETEINALKRIKG